MFSTCLVQGLYGEQQTVQSRQSCSSDILACIKTDKGICAFKLGSDPTSQIWTSFAERERERARKLKTEVCIQDYWFTGIIQNA